jgi:hypothetical protein
MRAVYVFAVLLLLANSLAHAGELFPFGSELMLDDSSMPKHKRMPMIEIEENGATTIDLWCGSLRAQTSVGEDGAIVITPGDRNNAQCDPDRVAGDDDLLDMIVHMTKWRRQGDLVEFSGATTLRYHMMTN